MRAEWLAVGVVAPMLWVGCYGSHLRDAPAPIVEDAGAVACPPDAFPTDLPPDREAAEVLYVLAAAPRAGDGSMESPFAAIGEALAVAGPGSVIAIGRGVYEEEVHLSDGITLVGLCVAETILKATARGPERAVVYVEGAGTAIRSLTIGPSPGSGVIAMGAGHDAALVDVAIVDNDFAGVWAGDGGGVELTRFQVSRSECGVVPGVGGEVDLHDGVVSECEVAVCLGHCVLGYDLERLTDRVLFVDNGSALGAMSTPVPGAFEPCEPMGDGS